MNITRFWLILQGSSWWNSNNSNNTNCLPYWFSVSWLLTVQTDCVRHDPSSSQSQARLQILEKISRTQIWYCQFVRWGILGYHWIFKIGIRNPELFLPVWIFSFMLSILLQKSIEYTWINVEPRKWLMWLTLVSAGEWKNILNVLWSVVFFLYYEVKLTDRIYSAEEFNYDPALWWHIT